MREVRSGRRYIKIDRLSHLCKDKKIFQDKLDIEICCIYITIYKDRLNKIKIL